MAMRSFSASSGLPPLALSSSSASNRWASASAAFLSFGRGGRDSRPWNWLEPTKMVGSEGENSSKTYDLGTSRGRGKKDMRQGVDTGVAEGE